jgi:Ca-activated chloride channel family protein
MHISPGGKAMKVFRVGNAALSIITSLLLLFAGSLVVRPQGKPPLAAGQQPTIKLNLLVLDDKERLVGDLRQEDFQVFEGDVQQTISYFLKEEAPVSYGLLIDGSSSLRKQLEGALRAGRTIIESNKPIDETFLVRFISSDKIYMEQDFTPNKETLRVSLNGLIVEGGQTAIIDAVYTATEHLKKSRQGNVSRRRVLILITDGEDRGSQYTQEELVKLLRKSDVQIFAIGMIKELNDEGGMIRRSPREKAVALLEVMAKETGGHVFFARSASDVDALATEIVRAIRTQYIIGYSPIVQPGKEKSFARRARVRLIEAPGRKNLKAIVRPVRP